MRRIYHQRILEQALGRQVSKQALDIMIAANLGQDALRFQFGHEHFHYDSNTFASGDAYVNSQRAMIPPALQKAQPQAAWQAFGRLSHAVQDLYAHSNYVDLWLEKFKELDPGPEQIDPLNVEILSDPRLHSGKPYFFFDALLFFNLLTPGLLKLAPLNSHTRMNIDGPDRVNFPYAYAAAVKRTQIEFSQALDSLPNDRKNMFIAL
jgi:hypothetical protein